MLSSQDARDRPTSSLIQRDFVDAKLDDADTEPASCKPFSIREYVFSTRGKHLSKNWPFHQRYIQVCRKHGVKDILPLFESPALVREREDKYLKPQDVANFGISSRFRNDGDAADDQNESLREDMNGVVAGISWKLGLLSLSCRDETNGDKVMEDDVLRVGKMAGDYKIEAITSSRYLASAELWLPSLDFASEHRKHLLAEEGDLLFSASDIVGNVRISVTENLTLENVTKSGVGPDVDCAGEASQRLIQKRHKSQRCKAKSRKKRRMVDICAKAQPCTLEDLDKKNGTKWALDPSVMPYSIPDSNKVKRYLVKRDGRNKPSNLPRPKLFNTPESTHCKNNFMLRDDVSQTKHFVGNNKNQSSVASSKIQCPQMFMSRDCRHSSAMKLISSHQTKEEKNIGASGLGHQNEVVRSRAEEMTGGKSHDREGCEVEMLRPIKGWLQEKSVIDQQTFPSCLESRQKSPIVHTLEERLLTNATNTRSAVENFARSVAQYKRKPRTFKRMRKVDSITSCVAAVKQIQDGSESELFQSEVTEFCHCSPRASIHSSSSYTQEGIDTMELKANKNLFPSTFIFEQGNSSTEPSIDMLAMTCSPTNTLYEVFQPYLHSELHHASSHHSMHELHSVGGKPYGPEGSFHDEICKNRMTGRRLLMEDKAEDCQGIIQDECELKPKDSVSSLVTTSSSNSLNGSVRSDHQPAPWLQVDDQWPVKRVNKQGLSHELPWPS